MNRQIRESIAKIFKKRHEKSGKTKIFITSKSEDMITI